MADADTELQRAIFLAFHPKGRALEEMDAMDEMERHATSRDGEKAIAAAIADQAKANDELRAEIARQGAEIARLTEAVAAMPKALGTALGAGVADLKAVLLAPVELEIKDGVKRAQRVVKGTRK